MKSFIKDLIDRKVKEGYIVNAIFIKKQLFEKYSHIIKTQFIINYLYQLNFEVVDKMLTDGNRLNVDEFKLLDYFQTLRKE